MEDFKDFVVNNAQNIIVHYIGEDSFDIISLFEMQGLLSNIFFPKKIKNGYSIEVDNGYFINVCLKGVRI